MGGSQSVLEKQASQFRKEEIKGETPIFRSMDISLDAPLPDKFRGNIGTMLGAFEYYFIFTSS